jgi:hypothetical protein
MTTLAPSEPKLQFGPTTADRLFFLFLAAVLACVVWVGRLSYNEGLKNEVAKENAQAWVSWFAQAASLRRQDGYQPAACAAVPATQDKPTTWGECLTFLTGTNGALAAQRNPFTGQVPALVSKCDSSNRALAGALVLEKLTPTASGSSVTVFATPLVASDRIDQKLQIRVTYCDQGAYPGRPAETEF